MRTLTALLIFCAVVGAADEKVMLLTENGVANPKYSEYKKAPIVELENAGYYAVPNMLGEKGAAEKRIPFAKGILTNGDSTTLWKRKPGPYTYWVGKPRGELFVELGVPCLIRRVRISVLQSGSTGCARVRLYDRGNPLEFPEALILGDIKDPKSGWNEFPNLDRLTDGLRFVLDLGKGKTYLTIREIEVWGTPMPRKEAEKPKGAPALLSSQGIRFYAFDFGTQKSPVMPGFTGVWRHVTYDPKKGYGWLPPRGKAGKDVERSNFTAPSKVLPGLNDRDRGAGKRTMIVDVLRRDFVAAMGAYHTQTKQEFAVDVPNGKYRVVTFHCDVSYGHVGRQRFSIDAEGKRVVKDPYFEGIGGRTDFETDVRDGRLNLVFDGTNPEIRKRGFGVNGLLVLPVNNAGEQAFAKKQLARVLELLEREQKEMFARTFVHKPYVEKNPEPAYSAEESGRGFAVFAPNWMEMVYPNTVPTSVSRKRALTAFACRGEREPYAVAVRALQPVKGMRVTVSDLKGPGVIPASAVEVRSVRYHPQRIGSSWSREWRVMPQILDPYKPIDLPAKRTQELWLTVTVPKDAKAGIYRGQVELACDGGATSRPITVQVLAIDLAGPGKWVGMYWKPDRCDTRERMMKQIADMRAHGMNCVAVAVPKPRMKLVKGKLVVDAKETIDFLRLLKSKGLEGPIACHWGVERTAKRLFGAKRLREGAKLIAAELVKISQRPDTPEVLFYPVDEIGNRRQRETDFMRKAELIRQAPGAKVYCTVNKFVAGERCVKFIDYWCSNIPFTLEWEAFVREHNKVYMRYGPHYVKDPRKARNSSGFGFYRRGAVAMYYWHYQCTVADPYNDLDGGSRDWCCAYPGKDGPIPTLDYEGIAEGVDDLRYINTLNLLAERCRAKGGAAAAKALKALNAMLSQDTTTSAYDFNQRLTNEQFGGMRRQVADHILALREALGER